MFVKASALPLPAFLPGPRRRRTHIISTIALRALAHWVHALLFSNGMGCATVTALDLVGFVTLYMVMPWQHGRHTCLNLLYCTRWL
jgi:hypothetical protein